MASVLEKICFEMIFYKKEITKSLGLYLTIFEKKFLKYNKSLLFIILFHSFQENMLCFQTKEIE